jgi:murein L,D-transpeptidase YafK
MKRLLFTFLCALALSSVHAEDSQKGFVLKNLIQLDAFFSHHVIVVEKASHQLFIYKNNNGVPEKIASFQIATGLNPGDKADEGDKKTPEGIYQLIRFHSSKNLNDMYGSYAKIYGIGAFVLDYPNEFDRRQGKTGSGIWLHSTDDEARISKGLDSRGCVVVNDKNLKEISHYIDLSVRTPILVQQHLEYWPQATVDKTRKELNAFVESWRSAWESQDVTKYLSHYSVNEFRDSQKRGFQHWKTHKTNVFHNAKNSKVNVSNVSIILNKEFAVIDLRQEYKSSLVNDSGRKTLYLKLDSNYNWKIIGEGFSRLSDNPELAFSPGNRYFKD